MFVIDNEVLTGRVRTRTMKRLLRRPFVVTGVEVTGTMLVRDDKGDRHVPIRAWRDMRDGDQAVIDGMRRPVVHQAA